MMGRGSCLVFKRSDLRVEIKERGDALAQLFFDVVLAAFDDVHGDVGSASMLQLNRSFAHINDLISGKKAHAINQR